MNRDEAKRGFTDTLSVFLGSREEMTDEALDAELKAEGVDVVALVKTVEVIALDARKRQKAAWIQRMTARGNAIVSRVGEGSRYQGLSRQALLGEIGRRAQSGAQAFFRSYTEATEDDLRLMLAEFDAVNDGEPPKDR